MPGAVRPRWRLVVVDDHQESTVGDRPAAAGARRRRRAGACCWRTRTRPCRRSAARPRRWSGGPASARAGTGRARRRARSCCGTAWRHDAGAARGRRRGSRERRRRGRRACSTGGRSPARGPATRRRRGSPCCRAPRRRRRSSRTRCAARTSSAGCRGRRWPSSRGPVRRSTALRRALRGRRSRSSVLGSDVPLREEPAVRPLLDAMRRVRRRRGARRRRRAARLACSPLGGLDAVGLRRVRRALRAAGARAAAAAAPATRCSSRRSGPGDARRRCRPPARPVARARPGARGGSPGRGASPAPTRRRSCGRCGARPSRPSRGAGPRSPAGAAGERADRDLDAVLALFRAAETFVDRMPRSTPARVRRLAAVAGPARRTRSRPAPGGASVQVLTPAGAAGREWDVVVVAGVQEGAWPDLRLRDSLLGAQALVDLVAGRAVPGAADDAEAAAAARDAVLADELRSFVVACSRARRSLLVTAVDDADQQPSPFVDLVDPSDDERRRPGRTERARARSTCAGSSRSCAAHLEQAAVDGVEPDPAAAAHARAAGARPTCPAPTRRSGTASRSRPARRRCGTPDDARAGLAVQGRDRAALRPALGARGGGRDVVGQRRAEPRHARCTPSRRSTRAAPRRSCPRRSTGAGRELGLGDGWPATGDAGARRTRWCTGSPTTCGPPASRCWSRARSPSTPTGRRCAGRSTGSSSSRTAPPDRSCAWSTSRPAPARRASSKAAENPQLGAYQLAVDAGAFDGLPAGHDERRRAAGVPRHGRDAPRLRDPGGARPGGRRAQLGADAWSTRWPTRWPRRRSEATANDLCDRCPVRRSCPVRGEGGQVVA